MYGTCIFKSFKWASWMSRYVGSPLTFVSKGTGKEYLMSIAFDMVIKTIIVVESGSYIVALRKQRKYFGLEQCFVSEARE